ncbi:MAG: helix-turn-helix domain-containing protein [Eubacterium sp.]|nr:helix-turn-helix domain-containing protein [Eubacterium sp.]
MYNENELSEILSVSEVASILRSGKTLVYNLLETGELKGFRIKGKTGNYRISRAALNEYIKNQSKL